MKYLDITLRDPESNLACDEALMDYCAAGEGIEVLRVWQPENYFVVLGCSNRIATEVNVKSCVALGVPILRRMSGGGAVLQGPGCLNYTLVLDIRRGALLRHINESYAFVLTRHQQLFACLLGRQVSVEGTSDLAIGDKKFSGNAQYRRRDFLLFHGTILIDLDFRLMEQCLLMPSRQPAYRRGRSHSEFLTNLHIAPGEVAARLRNQWKACEEMPGPSENAIRNLMESRYANISWNRRF